MKTELVDVATADGLTLYGAFYEPAGEREAATIEAWVVNHGSGSNFTSPLSRSFAEGFAERGHAVLALGNRGHDVAWRQVGKEGLFGNAYERMEECCLDLRAAVGWLEGRGYRRIGLLGHSLGGVKVAHYRIREPDPRARVLVLVSAPRMSFSCYSASANGEEFRGYINQASRLIAEGRPEELIPIVFPLRGTTVISARTYLDKYGPEERFNLLKHAEKITAPLLYLVGGAEGLHPSVHGFAAELTSAATKSPGRDHRTIPGADHFYAGHAEEALQAILDWVQGLPA